MCVCNGHRSRVAVLVAAGVTWRLVIASAPWAARYTLTSVIDAAGAIYIIGGDNGTLYKDVWASTDGGAERTRYRGWSGVLGVLEVRWVLEGTTGVPSDTTRAQAALRKYSAGT
jgi:hypothetical protein